MTLLALYTLLVGHKHVFNASYLEDPIHALSHLPHVLGAQMNILLYQVKILFFTK